MKNESELESDGFTQSGITRYLRTVEEYAQALHEKSVIYGDIAKASGLPREVTHNHVRDAATYIANIQSKDKVPKLVVGLKILEYVLTAISAYALAFANNAAANKWAIPIFIISAVLAGILIAYRLSLSKS